MSLPTRIAVAIGSILLVTTGCSRVETGPVLEPEPGMHLLATPTGDPKGLLGRAVTVGEDGRISGLARALAPGCQVSIQEEPAKWDRLYRQAVQEAVDVAAGQRGIAAVQARWGKSVSVESEVNNVSILRGDFRGPCGDQIVTDVYVGTGRREYVRLAERGGGASGGYGGTSAAVRASKVERTGERLSWSDDSAWGIRTGGAAGVTGLGLELFVPPFVQEGEPYTLVLSVDRPMWVVLLSRHESGEVSIIAPTPSREHVVATRAGRIEAATLRSATVSGNNAERETIIAYGFFESADYELLAPPAGALSPEAARAYAEQIAEKVQSIPAERWRKAEFTIEIRPNASPQPGNP